jgi:hypothetical protein
MDGYKRQREIPMEISAEDFIRNISSDTHEFYAQLIKVLKQISEELRVLHERQDMYRCTEDNKMSF